MEAKQIKCGREYQLKAAWPGYAPERIKVLRRQIVRGETRFVCRFLDYKTPWNTATKGANCLTIHPSSIEEVAA